MDSIGTLVAVFFFDGGNWTNLTRGRIETISPRQRIIFFYYFSALPIVVFFVTSTINLRTSVRGSARDHSGTIC